MGFFKKKLQDERVTAEQNKIYREINYLIQVILLISVIYKYFRYEVSLELVATEIIIAFAAAIYYSFRATQKGLFSAEVEMHDKKSKWKYQTKTMLTGLLIGIGLSLLFGINSAVHYAASTQQATWYFILVFFVSFMIYVPFLFLISVISYNIAKNRSDKMVKKQLEDDDA